MRSSAFLSTCTHTFDMASTATNRGFNEQVKWERVLNLSVLEKKVRKLYILFQLPPCFTRTTISGKRSRILNNEKVLSWRTPRLHHGSNILFDCEVPNH